MCNSHVLQLLLCLLCTGLTAQADLETDEVVPKLLSRQEVYLSEDPIYRLRRHHQWPLDFSSKQHSVAENLIVSLSAFGRSLYLNLTRDLKILSRDFVVEERLRNQSVVVRPFSMKQLCLYSGFIINHTDSLASLSTCGGLTGLIQIGEDSLFIQPLGEHDPSHSFSGIKHQLIRHRCSPKNNPGQCAGRPVNCGTIEAFNYLQVDSMFQHKSLGVKINIRVSKLVLLHSRPESLKISHHGQRSLESFCLWQQREFGIPRYLGTNRITGGRYGVAPVDTAVLVTRTDFCVYKDEPCDTVGIAYLGGACSAKRKCVLAEDNGLNLAFTIAHELGHKAFLSQAPSYIRDLLRPYTPSWRLRSQDLNQFMVPHTRYRTSGDRSFQAFAPTLWNDLPLFLQLLDSLDAFKTDKPCMLFCSPVDHSVPVLMADKVIDGTPCGPYESDLCIKGSCKKIGCDGIIGSSAKEDACGVCNGNGDSCKIVKGDFNYTKGMGYIEAVVIPAGAWRIKVMEDKPLQSFLALKDSSKRSINSDWKIELPGDFELAGTTVRYVRRGLWEKISAKGPTKTPLHLMVLLFHDQSYGIHYEYTIPLNTSQDRVNEKQTEPQSLYIWAHSSWQNCTVHCGGGERSTVVSCMQIVNGSMEVVSNDYCRSETRPRPKVQRCNTLPCQYRWMTGEWGPCSVSCGRGLQQREVSCVYPSLNGSLMHTKDSYCNGGKPKVQRGCEVDPCPSTWEASEWSECSSECGQGVRRRTVRCKNPEGGCDPSSEPNQEEPCENESGCYQWRFGDWSKCSSTCGKGLQSRVVQCMHKDTGRHGDSCPLMLRPPIYRSCFREYCFNKDA
ncbi:PREDICTED: A disintegrin and metalloproteinase with thrombospondin motifs 17-like [Cyprinodon variegatus]|uniref:A disintegrin and metalloproteinase with thrombospondin motifs 17-like n=1 Tax=Cyprinodon variegatus TaxID=28743 RepID=UPI0007427337|nr:PREDICTED: A disintegrin and metalloproteinase with thrombospondin motifs 17-like [Cyprinodon variegatus]